MSKFNSICLLLFLAIVCYGVFFYKRANDYWAPTVIGEIDPSADVLPNFIREEFLGTTIPLAIAPTYEVSKQIAVATPTLTPINNLQPIVIVLVKGAEFTTPCWHAGFTGYARNNSDKLIVYQYRPDFYKLLPHNVPITVSLETPKR